MESEYRIPTIDAFVQGFKFENYDNTSYKLVLFDFSSNAKPKDLTSSKEVGWVNKKVTWKHDNSERIVESFIDDYGNPYTIEFSGFVANWTNSLYHTDIQKLIDDGRIRCKM